MVGVQVLIKEFKSVRGALDKSRRVNRKLLSAYGAMEKKYRALKQQQQEDGTEEEREGSCSPSSVLASLDLKEALEVRGLIDSTRI